MNESPEAAETLDTVCAHCGGVNRILKSRVGDNPRCAKCHNPLIEAHPQAVTAERFGSLIGRSDIPVLVDFWAPWCGPCRTLAPILERVTATLTPEIRVAKLNIDEAQAVAQQLGIRSIPTLAVFKRGRELGRIAGVLPEADLAAWARQTAAQG